MNCLEKRHCGGAKNVTKKKREKLEFGTVSTSKIARPNLDIAG